MRLAERHQIAATHLLANYFSTNVTRGLCGRKVTSEEVLSSQGKLALPLFHLMGVEEIGGILLYKVQGGNCS